jgi:hypothetical protein
MNFNSASNSALLVTHIAFLEKMFFFYQIISSTNLKANADEKSENGQTYFINVS